MKKTILGSAIAVLTLALMGCGSGTTASDITKAVDNAISSSSTDTTIEGTVPGTLIRAYGDNGSFYEVQSTDNNTTQHPFSLKLPAGMGFRLVMVTNQKTAEEVVHPIAFKDDVGTVKDRIVLGKNEKIDLGNIDLYMSRNEAVADDTNGDGILDKPFILDDKHGGKNPLKQTDADGDGVKDFGDTDHGGYDYKGVDPKDADNNKIMDNLDKIAKGTSCTTSTVTDTDCDGVPDSTDANVKDDKTTNSNTTFADDTNKDGYHDGDKNHDGKLDSGSAID